MRHCDLIPGETVRLGRAPSTLAHDPRYGVEAIFLFRTTRVACFERGGDWIELELQDTGHLKDSLSGIWYIAGGDRETRHVIEEATGEHANFTTTSRRAAAGS